MQIGALFVKAEVSQAVTVSSFAEGTLFVKPSCLVKMRPGLVPQIEN